MRQDDLISFRDVKLLSTVHASGLTGPSGLGGAKAMPLFINHATNCTAWRNCSRFFPPRR